MEVNPWFKVIMASDCDECEDCGEPVCPSCMVHYAECACPGPHQDDLYEYELFDNVLMARRLVNEVDACN